MNSTSLDVFNPSFALDERDLHIGVLASFFGQDLYSYVVKFCGVRIVPIELPIKIDGRRAWRLWFTGHL